MEKTYDRVIRIRLRFACQTQPGWWISVARMVFMGWTPIL